MAVKRHVYASCMQDQQWCTGHLSEVEGGQPGSTRRQLSEVGPGLLARLQRCHCVDQLPQLQGNEDVEHSCHHRTLHGGGV